METYKFETTVLPNGLIKIPTDYQLANTQVRVVLYLEYKTTDKTQVKMTAEKFFSKWAGIIENADVYQDLKEDYYKYLKNKYE